ncbi:hypothetical protein IWX46DRAFT_608385 [Phyllosticta citricarpa]|uniref:Secreted protein n=1 Tax=Phyllosticta citricarpa TaxID=55181 RepID=A0ABR1LYU2_9PEZI
MSAHMRLTIISCLSTIFCPVQSVKEDLSFHCLPSFVRTRKENTVRANRERTTLARLLARLRSLISPPTRQIRRDASQSVSQSVNQSVHVQSARVSASMPPFPAFR